jgi:RNA polymerase sigma-70 factor (ECF subfamily)
MTSPLRFFSKAPEIDWEAVYQAELPRIFNFFRYRTGDDQLAEDLTSETFAKAWGQRQRYQRDLASFSTWLFTIARNCAIDHFRKARHEVPLEMATQASDGESVESLQQRNSDFERLANLLSSLDERERELVALKYGAGLTNRSIARLSGLSESNVGTILNRVTQHLRHAWEADCE